MMRRSLILELAMLCKIMMMSPDISSIKMTRIQGMKKLIFLLMWEKLKSLQQIKVFTDQIPKNLKTPLKSTLMNTRQKPLTIFLGFPTKRIDLLRKTSPSCPWGHLLLSRSTPMTSSLRATTTTMNQCYQSSMETRSKASCSRSRKERQTDL